MRPRDPQFVLTAVATYWRVYVDEICSGSRINLTVLARRCAFRLLHEDCQLSWAQAAELLGHTPGGWVRNQALAADPEALEEIRQIMKYAATDDEMGMM